MADMRPSSSLAFKSEVEDLFFGSTIGLIRNEASWTIKIGENYAINTLNWRLLGPKQIIVTEGDHGHQFGLPAPVDAESEANDSLSGTRIIGVDFDARTGDLSLHCEGALALQILTESMAYESWVLYRDGDFFAAVANGGLVGSDD